MKQVKLTQGKYALVDDEDYEKINKYSWQYYLSKKKYESAITRIKRKHVQMSSMIMNPPKDYIVVHLDKNGLNYQKYNLRIVTYLELNHNRLKQQSKTSSQYKGVSFNKRKWVARITVNKKSIYLGRFNSEQEAALTYDKAAKQYFGEFAQLNYKE